MSKQGKIHLCTESFGELLGLKKNEAIRWVDYDIDRGIFHLTISEVKESSVIKTSFLKITRQAIAELIALPHNAEIQYGKLKVDAVLDNIKPKAVIELFIRSTDDTIIEGITFEVPEGQEIPVSDIYSVADNTIGELKLRIYENVRNALIEAVPDEENIFIETGDK